MDWTNSSVLQFAEGRDPLEEIVQAARDLAIRAIDAGWTGPPYDPIGLADLLQIPVIPRDDVYDARLVPSKDNVVIEYNPNRSPARRRFSLAHEVAHLLFPDYALTVRNRATLDRSETDDWQLEVLCNLAAAELLMPAGELGAFEDVLPDIKDLIDLRDTYQVSMEALLLRIIRLTPRVSAVFASSRIDPKGVGKSYRLDYLIGSRAWRWPSPTGMIIDTPSVISDCTAIGFSAAANAEHWLSNGPSIRVDAIGVAPYPGHRLPRVVGLVEPTNGPADMSASGHMRYVFGDATSPRGNQPFMVVHIVNDRARTWRGGFAAAVRERWPQASQDFTDWTVSYPMDHTLGAVHITDVGGGVSIANLVAQQGYGPSASPRIRYSALREALAKSAIAASERGASIHMPKIGTGQAGGNWSVIEELIRRELVDRSIDVTIYERPSDRVRLNQSQLELRI